MNKSGACWNRTIFAAAAIALACALAVAPIGAASSPGPGDEPASPAGAKKCKKKGKKGTASAKKKGKKCKRKKKRTGGGAPTLRASLIWSSASVNVDLVTVDSKLNATPPEAIFGSPASRPPPIPDGLWSGDVAGGPETFTDSLAPYDRPFRFFACVNPRPFQLDVTVALYDPGSATARVATVSVPPGGDPAPIPLGVSPLGGAVPEVSFICEQRVTS